MAGSGFKGKCGLGSGQGGTGGRCLMGQMRMLVLSTGDVNVCNWAIRIGRRNVCIR